MQILVRNEADKLENYINQPISMIRKHKDHKFKVIQALWWQWLTTTLLVLISAALTSKLLIVETGK